MKDSAPMSTEPLECADCQCMNCRLIHGDLSIHQHDGSDDEWIYCSDCDGSGYLDDEEGGTCPACTGTGHFITRTHTHSLR